MSGGFRAMEGHDVGSFRGEMAALQGPPRELPLLQVPVAEPSSQQTPSFLGRDQLTEKVCRPAQEHRCRGVARSETRHAPTCETFANTDNAGSNRLRFQKAN